MAIVLAVESSVLSYSFLQLDRLDKLRGGLKVLDENELKLAINSFLTRKQKQFPDLDLNGNAELLNLELVSPSPFEVPEKKYRPT